MTLDNRLHPCPICGAKAFVSHDIVDGFEFGWSVGCPRACIKDGIHGFDDYETFQEARLTMFCLNSKEQAIEKWNKRCERKEGEWKVISKTINTTLVSCSECGKRFHIPNYCFKSERDRWK